MIRAVSRRLERLETRFVPINTPEPRIIEFVDADGTVTGSVVLHPGGKSTWTAFEVPNLPRTWMK